MLSKNVPVPDTYKSRFNRRIRTGLLSQEGQVVVECIRSRYDFATRLFVVVGGHLFAAGDWFDRIAKFRVTSLEILVHITAVIAARIGRQLVNGSLRAVYNGKTIRDACAIARKSES